LSDGERVTLMQFAIRLVSTHHRCMNAYSEDLRKKIVEAKERGMPTVEVARTFGVGIPRSSATLRRRAKGVHCVRRGTRAEPRKPASAQGGSLRPTSSSDRPPRSAR
jgi:transposase